MPNPRWPAVQYGDEGDAVRQAGGIVGQQTWDAAGSLEFVVGLQHTVGVQPV